MTGEDPLIPAFRRGAWQPSLDTAPLPGDTGLRLALVPEVVAAADRRWWQAQVAALPGGFDAGARRKLLAAALELFAGGTVTVPGPGPQSARDFRRELWRTAGLPAPLVDRWCGLLRDRVARQAPVAADDALVLVSLPGNTFCCLEAVAEQAAAAGAVWARPSRREPLSAARLVAALLQVGWPPERLGFYPSGQQALPGLIRLTQRQVVYGGAGLAEAMGDAPGLTVRGPGRGCALLPTGFGIAEAVGRLLPLVVADSGRFCSNVRTIVCPDGPERARELAQALGAALDSVRTSPADPRWPLTASRVPGEACRLAEGLLGRLRPGDRLVTRRPVVCRSDGGEFLAPALVLLAGPVGMTDPHPLVGYEVPFPFAAVVSATAGEAGAIAAGSLFVHRLSAGGAP
ncbi:hypothetical protein ACIHFE_19910 [Streptomyces sp. NPDC052396]|uniref:hypothetical protein n=1 Tax=Streptomyces sp. NPDC052396 TaxID=3365689 RepID=UPI0037CE8E27